MVDIEIDLRAVLMMVLLHSVKLQKATFTRCHSQ